MAWVTRGIRGSTERRLYAISRALSPALSRRATSASTLASTVTCSAEDRSSKVALVVGAGDALGSSIARRFAAGDYTVCVARRNLEKLDPLVSQIHAMGHTCHPYQLDARNEDAVVDVVARIEREVGPIECVVHNIGANIRFGICETTAKKYYKVWEMAAFSAFLTGREVAKYMLKRQRGTIIFTGATASVRGAANFAAFAGAMHAKRALAQSMASELGPLGIHVAHMVIDGGIDTTFVRDIMGEELFAERKRMDGILDPDAIAENYFNLHAQPRNAWTFEMDLRPWVERKSY